MLDEQGRIVIPQEQLSRIKEDLKGEKVDIYFDPIKKSLILKPSSSEEAKGHENIYYITTHVLTDKGRIFIPKSIRKAFSKATYLSAENDGEIYILIIEHEKKEE